MFVLAEPGLDVADALEVFLQLVGIGAVEACADAPGVVADGVENAAFLGEHGLSFAEWHRVVGEESVKDRHWVFEAGDGFSPEIPSKGEAGAVPGVLGIGGVELEGGEAGVLSEVGGGDLVGADTVVEALAGFGVAVGAGEPEGTAPVRFVAEAIGATLDHGEVFMVAGEGSQSLREVPVGACLLDIGEPSFLGNAPAEAQEDEAFGRCADFRIGEGAEAEGLEKGQGDERGGATEEMAAGVHREELVFTCGRVGVLRWMGCRGSVERRRRTGSRKWPRCRPGWWACGQ
ncbi:MAG: hypothetical protein RLZZ399_1145 [Verrucomicrobiota bacterium]